VIERLRDAAAEGRLAAHELEHRVMAALRARTYGELDATVSDLPTARPDRRRRAAGRTVAIVRDHPIALVAVIPIVIVVVAAMIAIAMIGAAVTLLALALGVRRGIYGRQLCRRGGIRGLAPWL
jgi:ABC-type transport system involved in cytochrome bd biosynthesis fused ATPase/permease subunit